MLIPYVSLVHSISMVNSPRKTQHLSITQLNF